MVDAFDGKVGVTYDAVVTLVCKTCGLSDLWDDSHCWDTDIIDCETEAYEEPTKVPPLDDAGYIAVTALDAAQSIDNLYTEISNAVHYPDNVSAWLEAETTSLEDYVVQRMERLLDEAVALGYWQAKHEYVPNLIEARLATLIVRKKNDDQKVRVIAANKAKAEKADVWRIPALEFAKRYRAPNGDLPTERLAYEIKDAQFMRDLRKGDKIDAIPSVSTIKDFIRKSEELEDLEPSSHKRKLIERNHR